MNGVLGGLVGITAGADQMGPTDAILNWDYRRYYHCSRYRFDRQTQVG